MVKDTRNHADTQGWGYAIFGANGKTLPDNPARIVQSCVACHEAAKPRGYAFLGVMNPEPVQAKNEFKAANTINPNDMHGVASVNAVPVSTLVQFKTIPRQDVGMLPMVGNTNEHLAFKTELVDVVTGTFAQPNHVFSGTLNELRPILISHVRSTGRSTALVSHDRQYWLVVEPSTPTCVEVRFRVPSAAGVPLGDKVCF